MGGQCREDYVRTYFPANDKDAKFQAVLSYDPYHFAFDPVCHLPFPFTLYCSKYRAKDELIEIIELFKNQTPKVTFFGLDYAIFGDAYLLIFKCFVSSSILLCTEPVVTDSKYEIFSRRYLISLRSLWLCPCFAFSRSLFSLVNAISSSKLMFLSSTKYFVFPSAEIHDLSGGGVHDFGIDVIEELHGLTRPGDGPFFFFHVSEVR